MLINGYFCFVCFNIPFILYFHEGMLKYKGVIFTFTQMQNLHFEHFHPLYYIILIAPYPTFCKQYSEASIVLSSYISM
jgi:hypothetical protein